MPTDTDLDRLIELDRRAVTASVAVVDGWDGDALPTPCAPWRLGELVAHMTVQQEGFARAADGKLTGLADWQPRAHADPVAAYRAASDRVLDAFARLNDPQAPVLLPELAAEPFPARSAVAFHLVDNVVHAWDVAAARGLAVDLDDDVIAATLPIARMVTDGTERDRPGAAFAHRLPVCDDTPGLEEILLLLGRDPRAWSLRA